MKKIFFLSFFLYSVALITAQNTAPFKSANSTMMTSYNINPNTLNYDLKYERLDLTLNPSNYYIAGSATLHFLPNQSLNAIYFDFSNLLDISQVSYHGNNLSFSQLATKEIKINFDHELGANVLDSLTIHYSGAPDTSNEAFSTTVQNGTPVMFTLSEPYGAQDWFPTKQSMNDKIERFDFKITTPAAYNVAANGKLMSETVSNGNKLTFWRTQYPTAAYLIAFSITNFTKITDTIGNSNFPFINYLYPSSASDATIMSNIEWTKLAMLNFENYFGPYPFPNEKYGHMEFSQNGTCMEHQTMSSMSSWGKTTIAHELAHQWFGDKLTCGTWNEIWLNEGFATFGEHLTNEKLLMSHEQFMNYLLNQKNYITNSPNGSVYIQDSELQDENRIFSNRLTYAKGGYLIRMIKWILGDDLFYQSIKEYNNRENLAYNYTSTTDFKNSLLQSTGIDFTEFFNDWLYGQGYPSYQIKWKQNSNQSISFLVNQTQSNSSVDFFEMPLPIKINGTNGETAYLVLNNTHNNQNFNFPLTFTVAEVVFNYEYQLLEKNSTISVDNTLSVDDIVTNPKIKIYPNPSKHQLNISGLSQNTEYKILNLEGILVGNGNTKKSIDTSKLTKGIYILKIDNQSFKFIKE